MQRLRIAPENPQAHNLMGMILTEGNRPQIGEFHYRRVLELTRERNPILLANLAWNLKNQGRMQEARALYEESVGAAPNVRQTLLGFARLEEADRDFAAGAALVERLEALFPDDPGVRLTKAVLYGRMRRYDEALAVIDGMVTGDARLGPNELLEKGRLLDQLGRYDDAWAAFDEGKRLAREIPGQSYLDVAAQRQITRLRGFSPPAGCSFCRGRRCGPTRRSRSSSSVFRVPVRRRSNRASRRIRRSLQEMNCR